FLLIIVLFTNKRSHPWIKGIAAAILIAVIIGNIYLNASGGVSGESGSSASAMDAGTIIITILAVLGVGVTAFVMFKSKSQGSQSSQQSGGGGGNAAMSISANRNPKKTTIKGKVLDYRVKSKGTPLKGLKVTAETDPIISNLEATTNNNGEFEISFPESIPAVIKIKKIETEYSGIKYNHLMYNGRPNINTGNRGSEFNLTKGKTIHNIVVPINKPSVPLAAGEARIKGKVMHYAADGKSGASITGAAIKLTKGADVKNTVTDSLGNFQITLLAAELPKYDGSELTAEVSGETYSHRFIFGCFDKKRALAKPQTGKELEAVIPVIVPEFLTQFKNNAEFYAFYTKIIDKSDIANFLNFDLYFVKQLISLIQSGAKMNEAFPNNTNPASGSTTNDWDNLADNFNSIFASSANKDNLIMYYWNIIMETLIALPGENVFSIKTPAQFNKLIDDLKNASGALKNKYDKVKV
ncbi:MAG: carboxypeptidase-like regulatory domain-containing protein, partial [Candidatus Nanoarchaeia archaeon]